MKADLERRIAELSAEIRNYPTPIARCDEQLPALLEERAELLRQLQDIQSTPGGCTPPTRWANDGGSAA